MKGAWNTAIEVPGTTTKLLGHPKMRTSAARFGIPRHRYQLIGVAELAVAARILAGLRWHLLGWAAGRSGRDMR